MKGIPSPLQVFGQALSDWWDEWVNMVAISTVWILCWLTIVLGPPATFGLYYATSQMARGETMGPGSLLEGARRYFVKSWLWGLLNLIVIIVAVGDVWFYAQMDKPGAGLLQGIFLILILVWLVVQFYALPYLMEMEEGQKKLRSAMRNALLTVIASPVYMLVIAGLGILIAVLSIGLMVPLFMGGPCLVAVLGNRALQEWLEVYRDFKREAASSDEGDEALNSDEENTRPFDR